VISGGNDRVAAELAGREVVHLTVGTALATGEMMMARVERMAEDRA
jgi:hypothetical protein